MLLSWVVQPGKKSVSEEGWEVLVNGISGY